MTGPRWNFWCCCSSRRSSEVRAFFARGANVVSPRGRTEIAMRVGIMVKVTLISAFAADTERNSISSLAIAPPHPTPSHSIRSHITHTPPNAIPMPPIQPPITITKQTADTKTRSPNPSHYSYPPSSPRHEPPQTSPSDLPRPPPSLAQSAVVL